MNRRRIILIVTAALVVMATASLAFIAGRTVSPAQRAADQQLPTAVPAFATVENRALHDEIVLKATVNSPASALMRIGNAESGGVVTDVYADPSKDVETGDVLAAVNGEPVIAIVGGFSPTEISKQATAALTRPYSTILLATPVPASASEPSTPSHAQ